MPNPKHKSMGNATGKNKHLADATASLSLNGNLSERETSSTWYRYGVEVTDVYDVVEVLGQGHMGEVFTVRRKTSGFHTDTTRERLKETSAHFCPKTTGVKEEKKEKLKIAGHARKSSSGSGRSSIVGAMHKTKKMMKKIGGVESGPSLNADNNSNLQAYIRSDTADSHEPPQNKTFPVKGIMKGEFESKYSTHSTFEGGEELSERSMTPSASLSERSLTPPASPIPSRSNGKMVTGIEMAKKGVHFQRTFAVKTILTSRINKDQVQELVNEIMIMRKLVCGFSLFG